MNIDEILNKYPEIKAIVNEGGLVDAEQLDVSDIDVQRVPLDTQVLSDEDTKLILQYIKPLYERYVLTDDEVLELLHSESTEYLRDNILTHARKMYDALGE